AMSGLMALAGYPDRAPTMPPGEQAAVCGGIHAAQGILLALFARDCATSERAASGHGQRIEVSQQEAMSMAQETAMQTWDMQREIRSRLGDTRTLPGYGTYACADGHVFCMVGVVGVGAPLPVLLQWMAEEGMAEDLADAEWANLLAGMNLRQITALL